MRVGKKIILTIAYSACFFMADAQVYIELGPVQNNRDAFSSINVYGSNGLRQVVPYSDIKGSAFWKENWSRAFLYDQRDTFLGVYKARFNFATNELHYLDRNGSERAVIPGTLNKIVFMRDDDSTAIAAVFRANISEISKRATCKNCYVQELNQGDVKLLKITRRVVKSRDSLFGTIKKLYFDDDEEYFLQFKEKYEKIKKLTKDHLFAFLPNTSAYSGWINEHRLQFKKEKDFIYFLNYYNSTRRNDLP